MHMFPQRDQANSSQHPRTSKALQGVTLLLLLSMMIAAIGLISSHGVDKAHAATTWTPVWSDNFTGGAGTGVNTSNWLYDTGTGWGTGEIENMSNSTANVQQDGNGHLKITAIRDGSGNLSSPISLVQRRLATGPLSGCSVLNFGQIITGPMMAKSIRWKISMD